MPLFSAATFATGPPVLPAECPVGESVTSAVTRSWSDMNPFKLMMTFGAVSLFYSAVGQPFYVAIARQQCSSQPLSAAQVFRNAVKHDGWRSLFRGTGLAVVGTVASELVYYLLLEYGKEKLPLSSRERRSFGAGLSAELCSALVFNPFAVVSQIQMVSGASQPGSCKYPYASALTTTKALLRDHGWTSLFRGGLLSVCIAPVIGGWWYAYDSLKAMSYELAPKILDQCFSPEVIRRLPRWCTSTTDNALINAMVGAVTNLLFCLVMNPIYVVRLRVQTSSSQNSNPYRTTIRGMLRKEGPRSLWKGLSINMLLAGLGGITFGLTYEATKLLSDARPAHEQREAVHTSSRMPSFNEDSTK